ncbi:MAG: PAS domain S-box protein [Spirochaetes bacterium]|nr:PAS domain S-box protein [Spirochaetota bacterium]
MKNIEERIKKMVDVVLEMAHGNFQAQAEYTGQNDQLDSLAVGINMMIEEIQNGMEQMEKEKNYSKNLLQSTNDAVFILNRQLKIEFANDVAQRLLGYKEKELLDQSFITFLKNKSFFHEHSSNQLQKRSKTNDLIEILLSRYGKEIPAILTFSFRLIENTKINQIICAARDISRLKETEKRLQITKDSFFNIVEKNANGIIFVNNQHMVRYINKSALIYLRTEKKDILNQKFPYPVDNKYQEIEIWLYEEIKGIGEMTVVESDWNREKGYLITIRDVTDRRISIMELKNSLDEKDALLHEIHHRVKNNLQMLLSLNRLSKRYIKDEEARIMLQEMQNRIKSMAISHELLYQSKNFYELSVRNYIEKLLQVQLQTFYLDEEEIKIIYDIDNLFLDMDIMITIGLIVNELSTNSFKYAFPDNFTEEKLFIISLKSSDRRNFIMMIKDNGIGIPEKIDIHSSNTLGMRLVKLLVENQLEGELKLRRKTGTEYIIEFYWKPKIFKQKK